MEGEFQARTVLVEDSQLKSLAGVPLSDAEVFEFQ